jgi:hypothetical protein
MAHGDNFKHGTKKIARHFFNPIMGQQKIVAEFWLFGDGSE